MPELPEVETVVQGIKPHIENKTIQGIVIRETRLRWEIPQDMSDNLLDNAIYQVQRRAKYIVFYLARGALIIHLGMSGSLTLRPLATPPIKHDHIDLLFDNLILRYNDPRRFGIFLWTEQDPLSHPLLVHLGPEPLDAAFNSDYLHAKALTSKVAIKQFLMNSRIVVGVGNIYVAEALFTARIAPTRAACTLTRHDHKRLVRAIKDVLAAAIMQGGTTLKNFVSSTGKPGYFKQKLNVYGRKGQACVTCQQILVEIKMQNRSTVHCPHCQK